MNKMISFLEPFIKGDLSGVPGAPLEHTGTTENAAIAWGGILKIASNAIKNKYLLYYLFTMNNNDFVFRALYINCSSVLQKGDLSGVSVAPLEHTGTTGETNTVNNETAINKNIYFISLFIKLILIGRQ